MPDGERFRWHSSWCLPHGHRGARTGESRSTPRRLPLHGEKPSKRSRFPARPRKHAARGAMRPIARTRSLQHSQPRPSNEATTGQPSERGAPCAPQVLRPRYSRVPPPGEARRRVRSQGSSDESKSRAKRERRPKRRRKSSSRVLSPRRPEPRVWFLDFSRSVLCSLQSARIVF